VVWRGRLKGLERQEDWFHMLGMEFKGKEVKLA